MPSLRAKLVNRYIRMVMKPKRLHEIDPPELRAWAEKRAVRLLPKAAAREEIVDGDIRGEWVRPAAGGARTILYLHGGGYVFGSPRVYRNLTYPLAIAAAAQLFAPRYRLAPEHPCPAAIEDAVKAFDWLTAHGRPVGEIVIAGDSAGGGLALAVLLALKARRSAMPAGGVLFSPWTDLSVSGASIAANAERDAMFNRASIEGGAPKYLGPLNARDPRASPLFGDLGGLPPLLVFASESEMLFDDSTRLVDRARAAGVKVLFEPRDGLVHVWPLFNRLIPEAQDAFALAGAFIREQTGEA